jgi:hypothetical protein
MIKKIMEKIPSKTVGYMVICGGILILVILLGIFPLHRYNVKRSKAVAAVQAQIDEQKELRQIYQLISQAQLQKEDRILPNPIKTKLSRQSMDEFQDSFRAEAAKAGIHVLSLIPDIKTMAGNSQSLLYTAILKGEFADFRKLMIGLGALPYIDRIERINLEQSSDSMDFELKIWVALAG